MPLPCRLRQCGCGQYGLRFGAAEAVSYAHRTVLRRSSVGVSTGTGLGRHSVMRGRPERRGNFSAAVARMALENGGPAIALQILHYPPLDIVIPPSDKPSPLGSKAVLRPWLCEVFDTAYTPERAQRRHRFVSPAWGNNADGIAGIAPALVITAEFDRLRDEAKRYAQKLEAVGSLAEYVEVRGVDHGYDIMTDETETTRRMYEVIVGHVRRAIG